MRRSPILARVLVLALCGLSGGSLPALPGSGAHTAAARGRLTQKNLLPVAQRISEALRREGFVGSVLIAQRGKVLLAHAYGRSGLRASAPPDTTGTIYNAGDLTVPLTVSALLQLQDEGKLSAGDPACKYVRRCPADWKRITIENLLDCTSEIYDPLIEDNTFKPTPHTTTQDYLNRAAAHPLGGTPGHPDRGPCDPEPIIAGSIVQTVSGEPFPSYIEQHVLQPAGLMHSGILRSNTPVPGMATPYGAGHTAPLGWIDGRWSYGLMGLYTTVSDVYQWDEAWMAGKVVSRTALRAMMVRHGRGSPYGWGLYASYTGKRLLVASGETPWNTEVDAIVPSTNTVIIFLSNTATNAPSYVTPILGLVRSYH